MRRNLKRLLSIVSTVLLICEVIPYTSFAEEKNHYTACIDFEKAQQTINISNFSTEKEEYTERDGRRGLLLKSSLGSSVSLKLDVSKDFLYQNNDGTEVIVTVKYYCTGSGCFHLMYDSTFSSYENRNYQFSEMVYLDNQNMWKEYSFVLSDAYFGNRLNDQYDLSIAVRSPRITTSRGDVVIGGVTMTKRTAANPVQVLEAATAQVGNIFSNGNEKKFDVRIKNYSKEPGYTKIRYSVADDTGAQFWSETKEYILSAQEERVEAITVSLESYGTYQFMSEVLNTDGSVHCSKTVPFSFVNTRQDGKRNSKFGYATHFGWGRDPDAALEVISKSNSGWFREGIAWEYCDPTWVGNLNFALTTDYLAAREAALRYGMNWQVTVGLGRSGKYGFKNSKQFPATEAQMSAWKAYCKWMTEQLEGISAQFEIWNEPNHSAFGDGTPEQYAAAVQAAVESIRSVRPNARIGAMSITGLTADWAYDWYEQALQAGAAENLDAITLHPYTTGRYGETMTGPIKRFLTKAHEYNSDLGVWFTEMGWPTEEHGQTEEVQAQYITRSYMQWRAEGMNDLYIYYDLTRDGAMKIEREHNFAVCESNSNIVSDYPYSARKAYVAITNMNSILMDAKGERSETVGENTIVHQFHRREREADGGDVIALWSLSGEETVSLKLNCDSVIYSDMWGNQKTLYGSDGCYTFVTGQSPIYLIGDFPDWSVTESEMSFSTLHLHAVAGDVAKITIQNETGQILRPQISLPENIELVQCDAAIEKEGSFSVKMPPEAGIQTGLDIELFDEDRLVQNAHIKITVAEKLESSIVCSMPSVENLNNWVADIKLENLSETTAVSGTMEILSPSRFAAFSKPVNFGILPARKTTNIHIQLPEMTEKSMEAVEYIVSLDNGYTQSFSANVNFTLSSYTTVKPTIDGIVSAGEWNQNTKLKAASEQGVVLSGNNVWNGPEDNSFTAIISWDEENLYMCTVVTDDIHFYSESGANIWKNDSVQFGVAYGGSNSDAGESLSTEIGMADTPEGICLWQYYRERKASGAGDITDKAECAIHTEGNETVYELKLPWGIILPENCSITDKEVIKFSMLVNDNDGNGRKGWMEYASGIGSAKDTSLYTELRLIKPQD